MKFLATLLLCFSPVAFGATGPCDDDLDSCVLRVIAETATFFDECGKVYSKNKSELDAAFRAWGVLKLPIPRLGEALDENSQLRRSLSESVGPYFARIPAYEKEIECVGRLEMVRSPKPTLRGDSARLPEDVLSKYSK